MKKILVRFYDLIIKLVSVKTIPAVLFSVGYLKQPDTINAAACLIAWALVIGVRYAEKVHGLIKQP